MPLRHAILRCSLTVGISLAISLALLPCSARAERTGEQIFRELCAVCHGAKGEGTPDEYPQSLVGDKPLGELVRLIQKTMPKDNPGAISGEEARQVAAYIYDAFYSPTAQARNKPARIELSRLTVRQYRNAVADLVGSFRSPGETGDQRGLRGEYFKSRRFRNSERLLDRVDPIVSFDFGEGSPEPEKIDAAEFAIRWQGGVFAPETGEYEFILKTHNGARLWINDPDRALTDVWVRSGNDTEHRETIWLLGGRVYPLRLEMFKSKEKRASMALWWKLPQQAAEPIPARCLSPGRFPEVMVAQTPFPPDDRSIGYERGTSISKAWDQATTDGAIEVAGYMAAHLDDLAGARGDEAARNSKLRDFCRQFAERAFRRPLSDEELRLYIERQFEESPDQTAAVKRSLLLTLKSPRFLYRELGGGNNAYDIASRLSFGLWDSLPDKPLAEAAAAGELSKREQVAAQAERMLAGARTRSKLREFLLGWLKVDQVPDLSKDTELYPEFNEEIASDLRMSLDLFLDDVVWSDAADFRQLLLADSLYLNGRLARFYGAELPEDAPFQKLALEPDQRAGLLSHPYLLAGFAYTATSSPIHRGVFISRSLLGRSLRPPPEAVSPLAPDLHPGLSTRERIALQTSPQMCQACHAMINPLGFSLEHFDAVGRFRSEEKGKLIDAAGGYHTRAGADVKFSGVRELASFLASSEETHTAFVEQLFQHLVKQPLAAYGPEELPRLRKSFSENNFHIRRLVVEIMTLAALKASGERGA